MNLRGDHLSVNGDGHLLIEGVSVNELADRFGTPLFVMSENAVRRNYRAFHQAFSSRYANEVIVCVGMKANWGLASRRIIVGEGGGGEAFGSGELYVALMAGTNPNRIVLNGPNKSDETLRAAIEAGVMINIDSLDELATTERIAKEINKVASIALRLRLPLKPLEGIRYTDARYAAPGIDIVKWAREFKFGMEPQTIYKAVTNARQSNALALKGLMYHGGIPRRAGYYREEMEDFLATLVNLHKDLGWMPEYLNLGGGFVPYRHGLAEPPSIDEYAESITSLIWKSCVEHGLALPKLILEPGRFCWENTVLWLATVGNIKVDEHLTDKRWAFIDGNINEMGDPFDPHAGYHEVVVASDMHRSGATAVDVCGQLCNANDVMAKQRALPPLKRGDILAFLDMGAYNEAFASQSNAMPRSATVMVSEGRVSVVRRRETIQDVLSREAVPYWLAPHAPESMRSSIS